MTNDNSCVPYFCTSDNNDELPRQAISESDTAADRGSGDRRSDHR